MTNAGAAHPGRKYNWRLIAGLIAAAVVLLLIAANAHLVYVAVASQPDCVAHNRVPGQDGTNFRAARPAC